MVCSKNPENSNIKMDDDALKQVLKFKYLGGIFTEDWKNKEDTMRVKECKVMFNNKRQLICLYNFSLEIKINL
jgi:hypothetical protein